ncbi:MAG: hypothetical protein IMX01_10310 [Limnochordaceae bacterium]|nr:hypothetical protein [Limnochordaceae bacterium]
MAVLPAAGCEAGAHHKCQALVLGKQPAPALGGAQGGGPARRLVQRVLIAGG